MDLYVDTFLVDWMKETVENDCKMMALASNLPSKIVDKIETVKTGFMEAEVQNNYEKDGVPIGHFVDVGTDPHWIDGNPLLSFDWLGRHWFLPYVWHPGFEGHQFMKRGSQTGIPRLKTLVNEKLANMSNWYGGIP